MEHTWVCGLAIMVVTLVAMVKKSMEANFKLN